MSPQYIVPFTNMFDRSTSERRSLIFQPGEKMMQNFKISVEFCFVNFFRVFVMILRSTWYAFRVCNVRRTQPSRVKHV